MSGKKIEFREGYLLRFYDGKTESISEIAPLPGFSIESMDDILNDVKNHFTLFHQRFISLIDLTDFSNFLDKISIPPSLKFAVSCLGLSIVAQRNSVPIKNLLSENFNRKLRVNAVIGIHDKFQLTEAINECIDAGYETIKLKCDADPGYLPEVIRDVESNHPDILFRIDANRSWPLQSAPGFLQRFADLPIEYCEEPIKFEDDRELISLRKTTSIPIALDESIQAPEKLRSAIQKQLADVFVIKPMLVGSIFNLYETIQTEITQNKSPELVFTTSLESGIGTRIVAYVAAMLGSPNRAHGLNTTNLFSSDLVEAHSENSTLKLVENSNRFIENDLINWHLLQHVTSYDD